MPATIKLIEDNSLRVNPEGFELKVRLNWYRSMPLSCVERVYLAIDSQEVPAEAISFGINGHWYQMSELANLTGEYWYVQDSASLQVRQPGKIAQGETHTLEAEITLRAPYIVVGPGKFLTMPTRHTTTQVAG